MKFKFLFYLIACASLFPCLLSSPGRAWDPEAEIRQQNQQRIQEQRLCDLAKNNPTHQREFLDGTIQKVYVGGGKVVFWSGHYKLGCYQKYPLGKEYSNTGSFGKCMNIYKIIGVDLVFYEKCSGRKNTLKLVYEKI